MKQERVSAGKAIEAELEYLREQRKTAPRHGPGKKLAVVVVDFQRFFTDVDDPIVKTVLADTARMLDAARRLRVPVFLIGVVLDGPGEVNLTWGARFDQSRLYRGAPDTEIDPVIGPKVGDIFIEKKHASCFFETRLDSELKRLGVDTVLLAGTSTSGCIRSATIYGSALGYRMELVEECVFDLRPLSGPIALSEIHDRYADVISLEEAMGQLETIGAAQSA